jgi:hypothetical protein
MQAEFLNNYYGKTASFPDLPNGTKTLDIFLSIFGWGGKTKWYCLYMIVINFAVYRVIGLLASGYRCIAQKGARKFMKPKVKKKYHWLVEVNQK